MGIAQSRQKLRAADKCWCGYCGIRKEKSCALQILQICCKCKSSESLATNPILQCDGCLTTVHLKCFRGKIPKVKKKLYCSSKCRSKTVTKSNLQKDYIIPKFVKKEIITPHWKIITLKRSRRGRSGQEDLRDETFTARHKRCEALEKDERPPI